MAASEHKPASGILILEAIVTTCDASGRTNIAPLGPEVNEDLSSILLKPFRSSQTFSNLRSTSCAVVHVTDDVELMAAAAIQKVDPTGIVESIAGRWTR